jgi:hypothetical protein
MRFQLQTRSAAANRASPSSIDTAGNVTEVAPGPRRHSAKAPVRATRRRA